ncbi:MAG: Jag N-terminal domain-containing protein [Desulfopila sp.]|jgi:spoIIIJ-associated protein|nr:Jag N-terminal domain-containing protein [Desulfopila sp.]
MTAKNRDFYGKEVADAIKSACDSLQVPQEQLDIEVIETGTTGIFGLIRKKAHIRVTIKRKETPSSPPSLQSDSVTIEPPPQEKIKQPQATQIEAGKEEKKDADTASPEQVTSIAEADTSDDVVEESVIPDPDEDDDENGEIEENGAELPENVVQIVRDELSVILELMGYPSTLEVTAKGNSVLCHVDNRHEEILTGQDGKTLDSLQYLLRKIIARKVPSRLRLTVDVGDYRERRLADLKVQALELAEKVKEDGKTQVIAALSPSERRVIHMSLQDDKEIRSRSVGDGLFKKILIYKPGKSGKSSGRKRGGSRGRRGSNNRKNNG